MNKLCIYYLYPNHEKNIKKIEHHSQIYYNLIIPNLLHNDIVLFETNPDVCSKCNITFFLYEKQLDNIKHYLYNNLNNNVYIKFLRKLIRFHTIKCETDLIGTKTYWYIHICSHCNMKKHYK